MTVSSKRLRRWELALLLGLALAALLGARLDGAQGALADKVLRLHVLANSDSQADQALKLQVRDAVLEQAEGLLAGAESRAEAEGLLAGAESRAEAETLLAAHLPSLAAAGAEAVGAAGYGYPVTVSLEDSCWFPTRVYEDFALPAGLYTALRVEIGSGAGQNWWCVVFPPLCLGSVTETAAETAAQAGLTEREVALLSGGEGEYEIRFRAVELVERLRHWLEG